MKIKQPNSRHCFACGLENPIGLKLKFYQTADDEVTADYIAPENYQGYPGILHGGVTATILDEAVGRAFMGADPSNSQFVYTAELKIRYKKKVPIGKPLKIVGKQVKRMRWTGESKAFMYDQDGTLLVEATAILVDLPSEFNDRQLEELGWKIYPDLE